jgi:hypothetical protein
MAYNLIAEKTEPLDWEQLWNFFQQLQSPAIEAFPISDEPDSDPSFIGISIPFNKLDLEADFWAKFLELFAGLTQRFKLKIFDLYRGSYIRELDLPRIKQSLYE